MGEGELGAEAKTRQPEHTERRQLEFLNKKKDTPLSWVPLMGERIYGAGKPLRN